MEVMGLLSGGSPLIKKYQAGTTLSVAGVPVTGSGAATTDLAMVEPMVVSGSAAQLGVGVTLDTTGTVSATADNADTLVSVIINPDQIIRAKLSGGATEDTALALTTATSASANGTTINGATTYDDGGVWGYDGANAGQLRRADDAAGSVSISFDNAIASGDNFIAVGCYPCSALSTANKFLNLSTNRDQVNAQNTVTDTDNFILIDLEFNDESNDGRNNSYYHLVFNAHLFGSSSSS